MAGAVWSPYDSWVPDVVRTLRFAAENPVCWLHDPLLRYRVSGASMSQSLDGSAKIDGAYADVLSDLDVPGAYGLSDAARQVAGEGFRRKQALNQRYMEAASGVSDPPPISGLDSGKRFVRRRRQLILPAATTEISTSQAGSARPDMMSKVEAGFAPPSIRSRLSRNRGTPLGLVT